MPDQPDKQQKREARQLREQAEAAFDAGNYAEARKLDLRIAEMAPDTEIGSEATAQVANLRTDKWAIYAGLGYFVLFVLAWVYALW